MTNPIGSIVIFGGGFAAHMTALALSARLPDHIALTLIDDERARDTDLFYGTVTSPSSYDFLLSMNLSEPELLLGTDTAFSLGTRFENWGEDNREWTQALYRPLPIQHGVKFIHYVKRCLSGEEPLSLDPYIMSIQAANRGVFAHPPEGRNIPLATVEYGYHFSPGSWTALIRAKLEDSRINHIGGNLEAQHRDNGRLISVELQDGQKITSDLFIDCTDQTNSESGLIKTWTQTRKICGFNYETPQDSLNGVVRMLSQTDYGWHAETPLRGRTVHTVMYDEADTKAAQAAHAAATAPASLVIGRSDSPWEGNVVKLGHKAGALEPLTPAPIMLLEADIERLIGLIPTSRDMNVESREYNRRFVQDYDHAALFHRALFAASPHGRSAYERAATSEPLAEALARKILQFESRGILVEYDYEPFSEQDWTLLHIGMGRNPKRYDPLTDRLGQQQINAMLDNMRRANTQMGEKMPPHDKYMSGLVKFLKDKHG